MKIVITGGHLNPALCVIDALPGDVKVLMIGRKYGIEGDKALSLEYLTAQNLNIPFKSITAGRLQRKFTKHTIASLLKLPIGFLQAFFILNEFKPNVIFTFGGYISLPVAVAGFILRIPIVVHEQTLEAGLSNRLIAFFAKKVFISWESSRKFFPKEKTILTGNPVRKYQISNYVPEFKTKDFKFPISNEDLPLIYVTGGSSGSHAINLLIEGCLEKLLEKFRVLHQTGDAKEFMDFDRLERLKSSFSTKLQSRYLIKKFVKPEEVFSILGQANLVISRSGINIVTELISLGKPAILVPLPYSQNQEQLKNAQFFKQLGLGEILDQNKSSSKELLEMVSTMIENINNYTKNSEEAKKQISTDASSKIVDLLKEIE